MRASARPLAVLVATLALVLAAIPVLRLSAQSSTPAASGPIAVTELAPGVTAEVYSGVPSARAPGQTLYTARFIFLPGAAIFPHSHPGTTSLTVVSGLFGWTLLKGRAHIIRASASGHPTGMEDVTEVGKEVILHPGDGIYYEDDVVHTARGAGEEPAVIAASLLLTTGQPLLMPANMNMSMGTPASPAP